MKLRRLFFLSVSLLLTVSCFAQKDSYTRVDSLMREYQVKIRSEKDLYKITYYIRTNFDTDSLRLRAAFIWITENIMYDVKAFIREDPSAAQLNYVLRNKKAICSGYANLVKYFCDAFSIESEIVEGYGRTGRRDVFLGHRSLRSNHAWNAVKINGTWRHIDATWATGVLDDTNEDKPVYRKQFNETYYFTAPEKFMLNHLPEKKQPQFDNRIDKRTFKKLPLFLSDFLADTIPEVSPDISLISTKAGDTLLFRLKTEKRINALYAFSDNQEKASYGGTSNYVEGWIEFRYPVTVKGYYNLYIGYYYGISEKYTLLAYKLEVK
ncbi:MAG: transglutaminase domain-containing protein [Chitinophagaceae bacterium]